MSSISDVMRDVMFGAARERLRGARFQMFDREMNRMVDVELNPFASGAGGLRTGAHPVITVSRPGRPAMFRVVAADGITTLADGTVGTGADADVRIDQEELLSGARIELEELSFNS